MAVAATGTGVLELHSKGHGFLRDPKKHYAVKPLDPYVPLDLIRHFKQIISRSRSTDGFKSRGGIGSCSSTSKSVSSGCDV